MREPPRPSHTKQRKVAEAATPRGVIEIVCGCMFSGKTTELLRRLRDEPAAQVLVVKHDRDNRYSVTQIMTHRGDGCPAVTVSHAKDILSQAGAATEVIAIDEGHFFDARLPEVCRRLAEAGKRVIVATLDRDMWGAPFETIEHLKGTAASVCVKQAQCATCGNPATYTHRKTPIVEGNIVGGAGDFEPRCAHCWSPPREKRIS